MQKSKFLVALALAAGTIAATVPASAASAPAGADAIVHTNLIGEVEVPGPGDPNGMGEFAAVLSDNSMCYSAYTKRIGKMVMMAHIHEAPFGVAGPVIITLKLPLNRGVSECLNAVPDVEDTAVTMSMTELAALKAFPANYYVNVHTARFPAGAVRGQLG